MCTQSWSKLFFYGTLVKESTPAPMECPWCIPCTCLGGNINIRVTYSEVFITEVIQHLVSCETIDFKLLQICKLRETLISTKKVFYGFLNLINRKLFQVGVSHNHTTTNFFDLFSVLYLLNVQLSIIT